MFDLLIFRKENGKVSWNLRNKVGKGRLHTVRVAPLVNLVPPHRGEVFPNE